MTDRKKVLHRLATGVAAAMLLVAGSAEAHPRLVSTSPAPNATVASTNRLVLTFSERLVGPLSGVDLYMLHAGHEMRVNGPTPTLTPDGKSLVLVMAKPLARGNYRMAWHAVSIDTHRVHGTIAFSVK